MGTYTYGDSAHLHAVTSIGSGPTYTAKYDAVGNMTCRAPDNTTTCASTPTGAQLGYDNEGRLATWQNAPTSPTTTDSFLYDGEGQRVEQQVTVNGSMTTTTTYVAGGLEEITANGAGTTLTKYFTGANGLPTAERVGTGGPLSYLATDGQGTVSASLDSTGNVTSSQLYTPYGNARYSSGSSPTSMGYTGQRADSSTGLDFYSARYYDPVAGQFVSADTVADGLNRYGYVHGNPTTATDPSGHRMEALYDDYECHDCDFTVNNVTVFYHGCANPDLGCSYADATRAVVAPGQLEQKGTDSNPTVYKYGTKQNGALLTGYSGKVLDHLIQTAESLREMWQQWLDRDENAGEAAIDVASVALAFATQLGECIYSPECPLGDPEELEQLHEWWVGNLTVLEQLAVVEAELSVADYNASITALKGAASKGQTVWYRQMMWLGHSNSKYSQEIGGASFSTGWGDQPPPDALYAIGDSMMAQCAGYPSSDFGTSPGVTKRQDSNYPGTGPCN